MFKDYPDILTVQQMAQALDIGINTAYGLIHDHTIGCKRIGKKILIPKVCLEDYVLSARYSVSDL